MAVQIGARTLVADQAMPGAEVDSANYLEGQWTAILIGREPDPPATISASMKPKLLLRPTILDRYVLREVASPFLIGLVLFTFVLLIPHLADISDLLVGKSATWTVIGKLIFNILPSFLALTIPMAFLLAVTMGMASDRFDARRPLGPWLHRIVVNRSIDWTRTSRIRSEVHADSWREEAGVPGPESAAPAVSGELMSALGRLPVERRAVVVMRFLLDYTPSEIAAALELPTGTVNSRLRRALDQLGSDYEEAADA